MLITRTPYRFSLYGGGLDYPEWYSTNGARILTAGLDYYCYQTIRELPPFFEHRYRACYSKVERAKAIDDIEHPSIREVFRKYGNDKHLEISHIGDLPARSGIGSSSSFTVGLIASLSAMNGKFLGRAQLANEAINIEQNIIGENVGFQDQCAAAYGGLVFVEAEKDFIRPRRFIARSEYITHITSSILMGFDGVPRMSANSAKKISQSIKSGINNTLLKELEDVSEKGILAFGKEDDIDVHARITKEARDIKLALNGDNSCSRTQEIISSTEAAGSLCTRIMGAGGGGFFTCWAPPYKHEQIKKSVNIRTWVDVRFSSTGSQVIFAEN